MPAIKGRRVYGVKGQECRRKLTRKLLLGQAAIVWLLYIHARREAEGIAQYPCGYRWPIKRLTRLFGERLRWLGLQQAYSALVAAAEELR